MNPAISEIADPVGPPPVMKKAQRAGMTDRA